ncbi:UNC-like C-terminal-domain-containing protein [Fusarium tricinctum]|uniref:UNC-like C-terminal-domain-containing protein n=1 Tax=Fusarium tricinctum TaxID=61284 RepID=A0A8K0S9K7_9HYPO|nr:UNC-like C-terminal-domain-containing protein [Fusarium tricinctum]
MPSLGSTILRILALTPALTQAQAQSHSHASDPGNAVPTLNESSSTTVSTCDARTINYIIHTLPQSCLTSSWTSTTASATPSAPNSTADASNATQSDAPPHNAQRESQSQQPASTATVQDESQDAAGDGAAKHFMSFEDWKVTMLRKTGQDPKHLNARKAKPRDRTPPDMGHAGLGEEGEISLNFDSYMDNAGGSKDHSSDVDKAYTDGSGKAVVYGDGQASIYRSKDAGKTCKERFNYASFDAGATILKVSPGAQKAKSILVENKDSYMLFECRAKSKFVIVELSDDVLIDTVVLANFEFFSSMLRRFTVSVSDQYPVKIDKWKEIGTFEARNTRDLQPFLVENPQIYSKYVRIEFLNFSGKEFWCPVSLLRIHGSRMIEPYHAWNADPARDEDSNPDEEVEEPLPELPSGEESLKPRQIEKPLEPAKPVFIEEMPYCKVNVTSQVLFVPLFCPVSLDETSRTTSNHNSSVDVTSAASMPNSQDERERKGTATSHITRFEHPASEEPTSSLSSTTVSPSAKPAISPTSPSTVSSSNTEPTSKPTSHVPSSKTTTTPSSSTAVSAAKSLPANSKPSPANTANTKKGSTGTASGPPASPPVQEGFFKSVSKRLIQVETNLTLSLKYVEEQARHMSETLYRAEQKQISKATLFLENLNQTVLAELRSVREQYDQIWQSTVIALESQRDQSNREIFALSTRLNLLADEVVFQKRMAIVQAVLLLSCLLLVIFSRSGSLPYLAPFIDQAGLAPYDAGSPASRVRAMYGGVYDTHGGVDRQRVRYMPVSAEAGDESSTELHHRASFIDDLHNDRVEREQLSPPPTPRSDGYPSSSDLSPPHETQPITLRRLPAMHPGNSRKPLPALPENPSSP